MKTSFDRITSLADREKAIASLNIPILLNEAIVRAICKELDVLSFCVDELHERLEALENDKGNR